MPRSHTCPSCLYELGRVRALPDEHYGLSVVVCPACSTACVRTRSEETSFWRIYHQRRIAIGTAFGKFLLTIAFALGLWGMTEWAEVVFINRSKRLELIEPFYSIDVEDALGAWLITIITIGIGCFTRAMFFHWKGRTAGIRACLFILSLGLICSSFPWTFSYAALMITQIANVQTSIEIPRQWILFAHLKLFGLLSMLVMIGLIPGQLLGMMIQHQSTKRFRKLRNKLRKKKAYGQ